MTTLCRVAAWYRRGMAPVALDRAAAHLGDLIDAALRGEDVVLDGNGRGAVRLVPVGLASTGRPRFGSAKGLIDVPDDLDAPLDVFREYMEFGR